MRGRTPKNSRSTQAKIMTDAMHRAYTYRPAKIHSYVQEPFNQTHEHRIGPPRGFIQRKMNMNKARETARKGLLRLTKDNAYA